MIFKSPCSFRVNRNRSGGWSYRFKLLIVSSYYVKGHVLRINVRQSIKLLLFRLHTLLSRRYNKSLPNLKCIWIRLKLSSANNTRYWKFIFRIWNGLIIKLKKQVSSTTKYIILNAWEKYDDMLQFVAFKLKSQGQAKRQLNLYKFLTRKYPLRL